MSLINELKAKSNQADNTKQEIIREIKNYFDEYLNGDQFENFLKANIREDDIKARKKFMQVNFWEYTSGCSTTHFYCGGKYWYNPECKDGWESHYYKGIKLESIHNEICEHLTQKLISRMKELGFDLVSQEDKTSWLKYYERYFYFGW